MQILNIAGRIFAMILGLVGSVIALIEVIISVGSKWASYAFDPSSTARSHGFVGTIAVVLGIVGSFVALPFGEAGAALLAIAGLLMLYVVGWPGIIPLIFLGLAAILAYLDRGAARNK
jgi:hypothetical protein